jgi:hypothetical protein
VLGCSFVGTTIGAGWDTLPALVQEARTINKGMDEHRRVLNFGFIISLFKFKVTLIINKQTCYKG